MRIGLIGLGAQAVRRHLPALASLGLLPHAVYDPSSEATARAQARFGELRPDGPAPVACASLDELAGLVDAADVVVPPAAHLSVFERLVERGRAFVCEKPFCRSWPEARYIATRSSSCGVPAAYLENWIFDPVVTHLQAMVARGVVGVIQRVSIVHPNAGLALYPKQSTWRAESCEGGGALLDWGSHGVGLAWHLVGLSSTLTLASAVEVRATQPRTLAGGTFRQADAEDAARFELWFRTPEGRVVLANIDSSWGCTWMWSPGHAYSLYRIDGSGGTIEASAENTAEGRRYRLTVDSRSAGRTAIDLVLLEQAAPTAAALRNALHSLSAQGEPHPECSLEFATDVQMALGAVRLSAHRRAPVAPEEFRDWCGRFQDDRGPKALWDNALLSLRP